MKRMLSRLLVIPSPHFRGNAPTLTVGQLAANGSSDVAFRLEAPAAVPEMIFARQPLFIARKCLDADGAILEIPAESHRGGAK